MDDNVSIRPVNNRIQEAIEVVDKQNLIRNKVKMSCSIVMETKAIDIDPFDARKMG